MNNKIYYNIHDILRIKIETIYKKCIFPEFDFPFHSFTSQPMSDVDIDLNIGPFKPNFSDINPVSIDYNFYAGENYLYIKDFEGRFGRFAWDMEILNIEGETTRIKFNAKMPFNMRILYPNLFPQLLILRPLLYLKFAKKNSIFLHACGIQKDGSGFAIAGRSGSFKTSLLMDLVRKFGWESLGDDNIIISNFRVLSFHTIPTIFQYQVRRLESEAFPNIEKIKFILSMIKNKQIDVINSSSPLKAIFIIHRKKTSNIQINQIEPSVAFKKLYLNNLCEWSIPVRGVGSGRFFEYLSMSSFANPSKNIEYFWKDHIKLLKRLVSNVPIYSVEIPVEYSARVTEKFNDFLENTNL